MGSTEGTDTNGATDEKGAGEDKARAGLIADAQKERTARQAAEKRVAELEAAQTERDRKAAEDAGKHRELYEATLPKLTDAQARLKIMEDREAARIAALVERNAARVAALPEAMRPLVPDGLNPDSATAQIEKLEALARKEPTYAAGTSAGAGSGGGKKPTIPPECKAQAERIGMTPEAYLPLWLTMPAGKAWQAKNTTP